ncbi:hypothetical protein [Streptomyces sp. NPDC006463]|uniref:hypothetical protein n=1 Tax=Streptomyces sp. NPDC006463 TaxID=3364746 RepID=UPI0036C5065A
MTITQSHGIKSVPTPAELGRQVAHAREEFGRTVEALVSRTAAVKEQVRETASRAGRLAADMDLDSVRGKAGRAVTTARANRTPLIAATGVLAAALLVRRTRRARRPQRRR